MTKGADDANLRQLKKIESELSQIKEVTTNPRRTFFNGILYGAGALVGGILGVILLGWLLSIAGFIPGISEITDMIQRAMDVGR